MDSLPRDQRSVTDVDFLRTLDLEPGAFRLVREALEQSDEPAARAALLEHFRTRQHPRWFFDGRTGRRHLEPPWNVSGGPGLIERADAALDGRLYLLGSMAWDFGPELHWRTPEMQGLGSAPSQFKRCNYMRDLALAWAQTRKPDYAVRLGEFIERWLDDWPLVVDADFGPEDAIMSRDDGHKAMPTAFRVLSWLDVVYTGVLFTPHIPADTAFRLIKAVWFTALQYRRYEQSRYHPANHHLWERGTAPFIFGTMFPECPELAALRDQGRPVVCRHAEESFLRDGTYEERSTSYTLAALRMFTVPQRLARLNRVQLLHRSGRARIRRCGAAMARLVLPDASLPDLGDGRPGTADTPRLLGTMGAVFGDRTSGEVARRLGLIGRIAAGDRKDVRGLPRVDLPAVVYYPASGYFVAREAWKPTSSAMVFSVPGPGLIYNHAHDDALHVQIMVRGVRLVGTPMTELYSYLNQDRFFGSKARGHFFAMTSHNVVLVRGEPARSLESLAPRSSWGAVPIPTETRWRRIQGGVRARGSHCGYPGVVLCRQVTFMYGRGWEIVDRVLDEDSRTDRRSHLCRWHFEYGVQVTVDGDEYLARRAGTALRIGFTSGQRLRPRLYRDERWLGRNPVRENEPAPWILEARFGGTGDDWLTTNMEISDG